jgi:phosphopantothenoylcysteine decarboxylase/phosphopantothenate--cysteine ligase
MSRKKRVLIGISGSISAYKMADLVSLLTKNQIDVQCLLTRSAREFVSPLVLETLSDRPVKLDLFGEDISGTEHIDLARWPDLLVFAPASAHTLARLSLGLADDLLTTVALASRAPKLIAPAMNTAMWEAVTTQEHLVRLKNRGFICLEPDAGKLACGEVGVGKLPSVDVLFQEIQSLLANPPGEATVNPRPQAALPLQGQHLLITSGPTTTAIDAVRYITNASTGKMGAALAEAALDLGAQVTVIQGVDKGVVFPVDREHSGRLTVVPVKTAEDMEARAKEVLPKATGVIAAAAVMDYRVLQPTLEKQKRAAADIHLELTPSVDVLQSLREAAPKGTWFFGFAAETHDFEQHAQAKLKRKNLDWIFVNPVAKTNETLPSGFGTDINEGILLSRDGQKEVIPSGSKKEVAKTLLKAVIQARAGVP